MHKTRSAYMSGIFLPFLKQNWRTIPNLLPRGQKQPEKYFPFLLLHTRVWWVRLFLKATLIRHEGQTCCGQYPLTAFESLLGKENGVCHLWQSRMKEYSRPLQADKVNSIRMTTDLHPAISQAVGMKHPSMSYRKTGSCTELAPNEYLA